MVLHIRRRQATIEAVGLVEHIAVLRDTKHFVKDYAGDSLAPGDPACIHQLRSIRPHVSL